MEDKDYILCGCDLTVLSSFVASLEPAFNIQLAAPPAIGLTMVQAEDSVEGQPFYMGEAIVTTCEVLVGEQPGYGICLGDEPVRTYCMAVVDALLQTPGTHLSVIEQFFSQQQALIAAAEKAEYNYIQLTKVDFKLMEQD